MEHYRSEEFHDGPSIYVGQNRIATTTSDGAATTRTRTSFRSISSNSSIVVRLLVVMLVVAISSPTSDALRMEGCLRIRHSLVSPFAPTRPKHLRNSQFSDSNQRDAFGFASSTEAVSDRLRNREFFVMMGKGDGKKKRKKRTSASNASSTGNQSAMPTSPSQPSAQPTPLRVTNQINVPIRRQIKYAQMNKAFIKNSGASFRQKKFVRTKYRRTWDEEEIEQKAEERRRKGQDPDWDVILSRNFTSPLVIVDGYNIIHKWPRLKKHMSKGDTQRARQLLLDDLENLRSLKGWRIEVVFDGAGRSTVGPLGSAPRGVPTVRSADRVTSKETSKHGIRTVFTGVGIEADSYIEARCASAKNITNGHLSRNFIVATDDAMIRLAGASAGALCMSADRFVSELKAIKKSIQYRVEVAMAKVNGNAVRPEKLHGTHVYSGRFGRNSVVIEDKRKRAEERKQKKIQAQREIENEKFACENNNATKGLQIGDDSNWYFQMPNMTKKQSRSE